MRINLVNLVTLCVLLATAALTIRILYHVATLVISP